MLSRRELLKALGLGAAAAAIPVSARGEPEIEFVTEPEEGPAEATESGEVKIPIEQIILDDYDEPNEPPQRLGGSARIEGGNATIVFENTKTGKSTKFMCPHADLTYREHQNFNFVQWDHNSPVLAVRNEQEPMEVCIDFVYDYVSSPDWNKEIKSAGIEDIDLVFNTGREQMRFPKFVWESMDYDLSSSSMMIEGRCAGEACRTKR